MAKWLFDQGHGGLDSGAIYKERYEKNDVFKLTNIIKKILENNGEAVFLTRVGDETKSLSERSKMENEGVYDYFVSIHRNAFEPEKAKGVETYSYANVGKGRELAEKIQSELKVYFKDRQCKTANFHVLKYTNAPATLVEVGFIDNSEDNKIFDSNLNNIAEAIAKACLKQVGKNNNTGSNIYRIFIDGVQQGTAYSQKENIIKFVEKGLTEGAQKIEIIKK